MQCPLCREKVADENALHVHYLMDCTGYVTSSNTTNSQEMQETSGDYL